MLIAKTNSGHWKRRSQREQRYVEIAFGNRFRHRAP
jgi:hypothetical protein